MDPIEQAAGLRVELLWKDACVMGSCTRAVEQYNLFVSSAVAKVVRLCGMHQVLVGKRPEGMHLVSKSDVLALQSREYAGFKKSEEVGYLEVQSTTNEEDSDKRYREVCNLQERPYVIVSVNGNSAVVMFAASLLPPLADFPCWSDAKKAEAHAKSLRREVIGPAANAYADGQGIMKVGPLPIEKARELATDIVRVESICMSKDLLLFSEVMDT